MFTGLVERVGELDSMTRSAGRNRLVIRHEPWDTPLTPGDSVCVQGACLTVVETSRTTFAADVLDETLSRTTLAEGKRGARLNLERALRAGDRLGGHFVTGHVDGTARVTRWDDDSGDRVLQIQCPESLLPGMVEKGSIACDGISLTLARVEGDRVEMRIIPETWRRTSLRDLVVGAFVNIETDIIGKYVHRHLTAAHARPAVTLKSLGDAGFLDH